MYKKKGKRGDERQKDGGQHDEEINMHKSKRVKKKKGKKGETRRKKKTLISYQNTASNLAVLFIQTMSASNYPVQATN